MADSAMKAMKAQASVRRNAEEMNDYLRGMQSWEKQMKEKDRGISQQRKAGVRVPPVRASGGTVHTQLSTAATPPSGDPSPAEPSGPARKTGASAAAHTYDKGYKRWESFDVDAALQEMEVEGQAAAAPEVQETQEAKSSKPVVPPPRTARKATPATILHQSAEGSRTADPTAVPRPKAAVETQAEKEKRERDKGNEAFRNGDFQAAIRCYTACIGLSSRSVAAFSNRAMCYIKLKEWRKVITDATLALKVDPHHTKSLQRRAVARNALGMHRAALGDLDLAAVTADAAALKSVAAEQRKTRELLKTAMRSAPRTRVPVLVSSSPALPPEPKLATTVGAETGVEPAVASSVPEEQAPPVPPIPQQQPKPPAKPQSTPPSGNVPSPSAPTQVKAPRPPRVAPSAVAAKVQATKSKGKKDGGGKSKKAKSSLKAGDPKGPFELERMWRGVVSEESRRDLAQRVLRADGAVAKALFGEKSSGTLDASILVDILTTRIDASLPLESESTARNLAGALRAIASAPRFPSSAIFLSKQQNATLRTKIEGLLSALPGEVATSSGLQEATDHLLAGCM